MNIWSLIFGIIAAVCFALEAFGAPGRYWNRGDRPASWSVLALGLLFLTLTVMFQFLVKTSDPIQF